jgi:16S rRNA (guanine527-N7)-methyltransferase
MAPTGFADELAKLGVSVSPEALALVGDFLARLLAMNEQMNLTAITTEADAWTRHALDAFTLMAPLASLAAGASVLDVGSGGGVPAIPLAIARPDLKFTLVEATQKKAWFLEAVARALELENVTVLATRAEDLAKTSRAGTFDAVTARAVAKIEALLPWTAPFAKRGASLLFIKGERAEQELVEAKRTLARLRCRHVSTTITPTGRVVAIAVD